MSVRLAVSAVVTVLVLPVLARADAAKCTKTLGKQIATYAKIRQKTLAKCEDKRASGKLPAATVCRAQCDNASSEPGAPCRTNGDCPGGTCVAISDATTTAKLAKAVGKATAKITGDCAAVPTVGPACDGATTPADLATCVTDPVQDTDVSLVNVDSFVWTSYGDAAQCSASKCASGKVGATCTTDADCVQAPITDTALQRCQATISKEGGKYLVARLKTVNTCGDKVASGKLAGPCADAATAAKVETFRAKMEAKIRAKCTESQLAAAPASTLGFGRPCELYQFVTFDRGPSNTNTRPVLDRLLRCVTDAAAVAADRLSNIAYPGAENSAFASGVAAGDETDTTAVFWTRVPDSTQGALLEVWDNPGLTGTPVLSQSIPATPGLDGTIKLDSGTTATVLTPSTTYYYRFTQGANTSAVGRVKTTPNPSTPAAISVGWSGDANAFFRPFTVLDPIRLQGPDAWFFIGDTIYGDDTRADGIDAHTLGEYYGKYKENREDASLRNIMASMGTYVMWDDHEVRNDFAGAVPAFAARLVAGNQAFRAYNPIRQDGIDPMRLYRKVSFGSLAEFYLIDLRSYRSAKYTCCTNPLESGPVLTDNDSTCTGGTAGENQLPFAFSPSCTAPSGACQTALCDSSRTTLGAAQKAWLESELLASTAAFKFIMNGPPITELLFDPYDRWEGYPAERDDVLSFITTNAISNVVWLSTDLHGIVVSNGPSASLNVPGENPAHPGVEIVGGAVGMDPIFRELPASIAGFLPSLPTILTQITQFDIDRFNAAIVSVAPGPTATIDFYDHSGQVIQTISLP